MDESRIEVLLARYGQLLDDKAPGTIAAYGRAIRRLLYWLADGDDVFDPHTFTRERLRLYLNLLESQGYSASHRHVARTAASGFASFLADHGLLEGNPTRGLDVGRVQARPPRVLSDEQRLVLLALVDRDGRRRSAALFGLGYWAGCRVSDTSHLRLENVDRAARPARVVVGYKNDKQRQLDLLPEAEQVLLAYLDSDERAVESEWVFTSQRQDRLTEDGIHAWFRRLKDKALEPEIPLVRDVTYHDLRHDFAHRMRQAGWTLEELALYLGHTDRRGWPVVAATLRYTQAGREDILTRLSQVYEERGSE